MAIRRQVWRIFIYIQIKTRSLCNYKLIAPETLIQIQYASKKKNQTHSSCNSVVGFVADPSSH